MKTDEKSVEQYWTKKVKKALVGKKIIGVEYLPKKYLKEWMWYKRPIVLKLDNGTMLIPQMDDEGNDGGAIWTSVEDLQTIPVI